MTTTIPRGASRRALIAGAVAALALLAALVGDRVADDRETLVHREDPPFTLLHEPQVRRVDPQGEEYVRLVAKRGPVTATVTVAPLPAQASDLGALPVLATRRAAELRTAEPGFELREEGKANVNRAPGYQLAFRTGEAQQREIFVLADDEPGADGVTLALRIEGRATTGPQRAAIVAARRAFRSLRFGTERP